MVLANPEGYSTIVIIFGVSNVSGHTVLITIRTVKSRATPDVTTGIAVEWKGSPCPHGVSRESMCCMCMCIGVLPPLKKSPYNVHRFTSVGDMEVVFAFWRVKKWQSNPGAKFQRECMWMYIETLRAIGRKFTARESVWSLFQIYWFPEMSGVINVEFLLQPHQE